MNSLDISRRKPECSFIVFPISDPDGSVGVLQHCHDAFCSPLWAIFHNKLCSTHPHRKTEHLTLNQYPPDTHFLYICIRHLAVPAWNERHQFSIGSTNTYYITRSWLCTRFELQSSILWLAMYFHLLHAFYWFPSVYSMEYTRFY